MLEIAGIADPEGQVQRARNIGAGKKAAQVNEVGSKKQQPTDSVGTSRRKSTAGQSDQVENLLNNALETINGPPTVPEDDLEIPGFLRREPPTDIEKAFGTLKDAWAASSEMRKAWDDAPIGARKRFIEVVLEGRVK